MPEPDSALRKGDAMLRFVLICCGGAAGTGARYLLGGWIARATGASFPFGTLGVNAIGSFAIGLLMVFSLRTGSISDTTRVVLTTGVLGGFTTYSTFNYETLELVKQGAWAWGALNVAATVLCCLAAGALGSWLGLVLARGAG
jgi:CrcB protein